MRDRASAIAFFCWTLPAPIIACIILFALSDTSSGAAYLLPFILMGSVAGLILGALLTGWLTRTMTASLTGMALGLVAAVTAVRSLLGL